MKDKLRDALNAAANYIDALGGDSRSYRQALAASKQEPQATTTNEHTERAELTDAQIDEIAEQHATGQDDQDRYIVTTAELHEIIKDAAAMLEAQRPALRPLTDKQIAAVAVDADCVWLQKEYTCSFRAIVRATETAHGIKEQA